MNVVFYAVLITLFLNNATFWFWFSRVCNQLLTNKITESIQLPPVSVIVCYKNAQNHILTTIKTILAQNYLDFEVIAINDFSTDQSMSILSQINNDKLVLLSAKQDLPGKKAALSQAILHAKNEILLFTDADCVPASDQWITSMVHYLNADETKEIVLGYGPMIKKPGLLNAFARYETILTAMQYFTYARAGIPYMGVGRNLMYKKSTFERIGGFREHLHLASGDDDLLVSKVANQYNTVVNLDEKSFVYSEAKDTFNSYLNQKIRHISTSYHYTFKHQFLLTLFALSQLSFYLLLIVGSIFNFWTLKFGLLILTSKWVVQMFLHNNIFEHLNGKDIKWYFPFLDITMTIYYIILPIFRWFRKTEW
jgi:glycosyltransferase involved in cell wall biosynthesis